MTFSLLLFVAPPHPHILTLIIIITSKALYVVKADHIVLYSSYLTYRQYCSLSSGLPILSTWMR